jgi:hypothetical protein
MGLRLNYLFHQYPPAKVHVQEESIIPSLHPASHIFQASFGQVPLIVGACKLANFWSCILCLSSLIFQSSLQVKLFWRKLSNYRDACLTEKWIAPSVEGRRASIESTIWLPLICICPPLTKEPYNMKLSPASLFSSEWRWKVRILFLSKAPSDC